MGQKSAARIAVVGDERFFCDALRRVFSGGGSLEVVLLDDSLDRGTAVLDAGVNFLIADHRMSGAVELCAAMVRAHGPAVIFVNVPDDDTLAAQAVMAGARGIVYRSSPVDEVIAALGIVESGRLWAPRHVLAAALTSRQRDLAPVKPRDEAARDQRLSGREREILEHAAAGWPNKEVAVRLAISEATVKVHLTHIFRKLGVRNRTELAALYHAIPPLPSAIP